MEMLHARRWKWQRLKSTTSPAILVMGYSGIAGWCGVLACTSFKTIYLTLNKAKNVYCKQVFLYCIVGTHMFRTLQLRMCTIECVSYESRFSMRFFSYDIHYEILSIVFMPRHCGLNATLSSRACVLCSVLDYLFSTCVHF